MRKMMQYKQYQFNRVYEFAKIIYDCLDADNNVELWYYDEEQFINAATNFSKNSLLHIFVYYSLFGYYNEILSDNNDYYSEEEQEYEKWLETSNAYGISFHTELDYDDENVNFYKWYEDNIDVFDKIFESITDEIVHIIFADHNFLIKFNKFVASIIKNENEERDWSFPENVLTKEGTIKRKPIPVWVKEAVFHRDHGKCVFCGVNLTGQYEHSTKCNYDHIIPLNKYGVNDPCNIQLTCEHCNKSKKDSNEIPQYYYESWW